MRTCASYAARAAGGPRAQYVAEHGETRIDDLARHFDVSLMTMHRDLDDLAGRHLLRKERGRAVAFPALTMETATHFRENSALAAKNALCAAVAARIRPGSTVLMDDSTTLFPLAPALARLDQLHVVTNSVGLPQPLGSAPGALATGAALGFIPEERRPGVAPALGLHGAAPGPHRPQTCHRRPSPRRTPHRRHGFAPLQADLDSEEVRLSGGAVVGLAAARTVVKTGGWEPHPHRPSGDRRPRRRCCRTRW
ncbi:DeoR family transcriptional regulator [Streptomyces sp. NPDC001401]|uniref:DeoR family transcriptional regulator n=1 Tax=Streptomyces sp. NPDC001401 TaxID=3364570 RepID=UPI003684DBDE